MLNPNLCLNIDFKQFLWFCTTFCSNYSMDSRVFSRTFDDFCWERKDSGSAQPNLNSWPNTALRILSLQHCLDDFKVQKAWLFEGVFSRNPRLPIFSNFDVLIILGGCSYFCWKMMALIVGLLRIRKVPFGVPGMFYDFSQCFYY